MSREELLRVASGHLADMRSEKGWDVFVCRYRLLVRRCWWQMRVTYDDEGKVKAASVHFIDPNCGWFSKPNRYLCCSERPGGS